jgi:hypothetical protein
MSIYRLRFLLFRCRQFFRRFPFFAPDVVLHFGHARLPGAVGAAEKILFRLDAVTDNFAAAMSADRRKFMNRALETIKNVTVARRYHFKR